MRAPQAAIAWLLRCEAGPRVSSYFFCAVWDHTLALIMARIIVVSAAGDVVDEIIAKAEDAERSDEGGGVIRDTKSALGGFMRFLGALSR